MSCNLNIDTLRKRAAKFAKEFSKAHYEMGEAQNFIRALCEVFALDYRCAVRFEERVKKLTGQQGRIDGFFPGLLLIEMKSAGANLEQAYLQASGYLSGLKPEQVPNYILVSDFVHLHLYDLVSKAEPVRIKLADFANSIEPFLFMAGYQAILVERRERINKQAAEKMARLHDAIKATGYDSKDLEIYLVRLLFCLFADSTGLFGNNGVFLDYLINHTHPDGSDLHGALDGLFDTLNKPDEHYLKNHPDYQGKKRLKNLTESRSKFSYINGTLFEVSLEFCEFDADSRNMLIDCAQLDWSEISPAIFGSLFQEISNRRRELGEHYTSEENILKVINPLFMDDLRKDLAKCGNNKHKLHAFHERLATLNFFDPACGCGNFLVIAYRELRLLELQLISKLWSDRAMNQIDINTLIRCNVHQFHGIEIEPSAVQIATVALWLTDHQMNLKVESLGLYFHRIPLEKKANIVCANALRIDWATLIAPEQCSFIMGNPPFIGYSYQTDEQKVDLALIFNGMNGAGVLDYVAAWHIKAARYIQVNPKIPVAFVSTNSLTQGEQVAILWTELLKLKIKLHFAHRTFRWSNEGRGVAAVHCVIMGFGLQEPSSYRLFDYADNIRGIPIEVKATQINPYLVDAPTILIKKRRHPLSPNAPEMIFGSKPTDGGHLLLSQAEVDSIRQNKLLRLNVTEMIKGSQPTDGGHLLLSQTEVDGIREHDPIASKYIRQFLGADEFINNIPRYCLWLKDSTTSDRLNSPEIKSRIEKIKKMRLASKKLPTQKLAETPYLFGEIRQTDQPYLLIPRVSSEQRKFVPIGYFKADVICGDANFMLPNASLYDFGLLTSTFHNAWMRIVCGRLKSDYRYSNTIVYNNFPFPETVRPAQLAKITNAAQQVLNARKAEEDHCAAQGQTCSLAIMYAANNMPQDLLKAHNALDKAVDAAYSYKGGKDDVARVAFLFELYQKLTAPLVTADKMLK